MIGIISFILCLVAWFFTIVMVYVFEGNKKEHDAITWICFLFALLVFAVVSYL